MKLRDELANVGPVTVAIIDEANPFAACHYVIPSLQVGRDSSFADSNHFRTAQDVYE